MGLLTQIPKSVGCAERDVKESGAQVAKQIEAAPRLSTRSAPGSPPPAIQICEMMAARLLRAWDIMSRAVSAWRMVRLVASAPASPPAPKTRLARCSHGDGLTIYDG